MTTSRLLFSIAVGSLWTAAIVRPVAAQERGIPSPAASASTADRETLYFQGNSAELTPADHRTLEEMAVWLKANPSGAVVIVGDTPAGNAMPNRERTEQRARAARNHLVALGITMTRIRVMPYGEAVPLEEVRNPLERRIMIMPSYDTGNTEYPAEVAPTMADETLTTSTLVVEKQRPYGLELSAGGGVTGFVDRATTDLASVGAAWDARLGFGNKELIGGEVAYIGSAQELRAAGLDRGASVLASGVEGDLRINLVPRSFVVPYVFGGIGWTRYDVVGTQVLNPTIRERDNVWSVPAGAGIAFHTPVGLVLDMRGTYRAAFDDDLFTPVEGGEKRNLDAWSAAARAGWEF
jgi:hypothetical protein